MQGANHGNLGRSDYGGTDACHLGVVSPRRGAEGFAMSALDVVAVLLALGLGIYLCVALLKPEKFQ